MVTLPRIYQLICMRCTKLIQRKPILNARIESNGFEDIGQKSGSDIASSPRNMQRRMPSRHPGVIFCTEIFHQEIKLKLLSKASILAWCADHSLRMLIRPHYSGVVMTICASATTSTPKTQPKRTRRIWGLTSTLVPPLLGTMAPVKPMKTGLAPLQPCRPHHSHYYSRCQSGSF